MSSPESSSPAGAFCGNCGASVSVTDVICPACGVLLAAYQAPAGATGSQAATVDPASIPADTSATRPAAAPATEPTATPEPEAGLATSSPVRHVPRSRSPIGDALRRSRESGSGAANDLASEAVANELAEMAADDSALAREVEAELAGARVTFEGSQPVIGTDRAEISQTETGAPVVVEHPPLPNEATPAPAQTKPSPTRTAPPVRPPVRAAVPEPVPVQPLPAPGGFTPATLLRWLPFILVGCVMLAIGRSLPGFGGVIGFAFVIGLIFLLVKVAAASSRKTTSMPRDPAASDQGSRWRK